MCIHPVRFRLQDPGRACHIHTSEIGSMKCEMRVPVRQREAKDSGDAQGATKEEEMTEDYSTDASEGWKDI